MKLGHRQVCCKLGMYACHFIYDMYISMKRTTLLQLCMNQARHTMPSQKTISACQVQVMRAMYTSPLIDKESRRILQRTSELE